MEEQTKTEVSNLQQNETPEPPKIIIPDGMALVPITPDKDVAVIALVESAKTICQYAAARTITNPEDTKLATEDLSVLSKTLKAVKEKQVEYTKPYKTLLDGINGVFKPVIDSLDGAFRLTKNKLLEYQAEVNRKRLEAEEINRQAEELARRQAAANEGIFTVDTTPVLVPDAAPKTVRTEIGNAGMVRTWKYRVTDFSKLTDTYKLENAVLLNSTAKSITKMGIADIDKLETLELPTVPGVEFYVERTISMRTK
jgi:hypothetical protein